MKIIKVTIEIIEVEEPTFGDSLKAKIELFKLNKEAARKNNIAILKGMVKIYNEKVDQLNNQVGFKFFANLPETTSYSHASANIGEASIGIDKGSAAPNLRMFFPFEKFELGSDSYNVLSLPKEYNFKFENYKFLSDKALLNHFEKEIIEKLQSN